MHKKEKGHLWLPIFFPKEKVRGDRVTFWLPLHEWHNNSSHAMTDSELLDGIQKGDDKALSVLYKTHYKVASHFVVQNGGADEDAKEVYQEAVILLYEKAVSGHLVLTCKISTYLYAVCRRLWLRKLAARQHSVGQVEEWEEVILGDDLFEDRKEEHLQAMDASLRLLGEPCRHVIESYYFHHQSMRQICEKMGYANEETAKNQKYKCLIRLKKLFFGITQSNDTTYGALC